MGLCAVLLVPGVFGEQQVGLYIPAKVVAGADFFCFFKQFTGGFPVWALVQPVGFVPVRFVFGDQHEPGGIAVVVVLVGLFADDIRVLGLRVAARCRAAAAWGRRRV